MIARRSIWQRKDLSYT